MRTTYLTIFLLLFFVVRLKGRVTTAQTLNPNQLLQNVVIGTPLSTISFSERQPETFSFLKFKNNQKA